MGKNLGSLEVTIGGLRSRRGQILLALWQTAAGFPNKTQLAAAKLVLPIGSAAVTGRFEGLEPGNYAVAAVHDGNGNGRLSTSWIGVPKDGIGFSNNPKIRFGAPSFASCVVSVASLGAGGAATEVTVQIRYFLPQ